MRFKNPDVFIKGSVIDGGKKLVKLVKRIRHKFTAYDIQIGRAHV